MHQAHVVGVGDTERIGESNKSPKTLPIKFMVMQFGTFQSRWITYSFVANIPQTSVAAISMTGSEQI